VDLVIFPVTPEYIGIGQLGWIGKVKKEKEA
jgi:hypothetical protein